MIDPFLILNQVLAGNASCPAPDAILDAPYQRLFASLQRRAGERYAPGPSDLAALIRHVLRREQERQGGHSPILPVPVGPPWPQAATWEQFGLEVLYATSTEAKIRAKRWYPAWLRNEVDEAVDRAVCAEEERRDYGELTPGDPFLDRFPAFSTYRSVGQREAVRAVLTAPEGSTLVVNLPTASGKSLAAYLPSLLDPRTIAVIVVPTTALALDQERAILPYVDHPVAYHSGQDATGDRNRGIRERIRMGTQRMVFTSPEALIQSLAGPLYTATAQGFLRLLAIDEAHIVDQWGDEFRPEFQEIAGLRRDLLRRAAGPKPRTVLLTGTMTESCLDTFETLFGRPGPFGAVSAAQLRPEPSYWVAVSDDDTVRVDRVYEAVRHLPRPLLLYVTRVEDARDWLSRLQQQGYRRSAAVTGPTSSVERAEAVRAWQANDLDIIVATSAFGLGVDKADVRTVIHACLPEHVDRYYQEVGRGGRDGRACVSLLLPTLADFDTARRLNRRTLISTDEDNENKGYERWKAMYAHREDFGDGRVRVPLTAVPEYGFGRFENSTANVAWNLRTLALLARAGVIEIDAQPPPAREAFVLESGTVDEERLRVELERHRLKKVVQVRNEDHLDLRGLWFTWIEEVRAHSIEAAKQGLNLLLEALSGRRCFAEIFSDAYTVARRTGIEPRAGVFVSQSCGGCPFCRQQRRQPYVGGPPRPAPPWVAGSEKLTPELTKLLGPDQIAFLFDERLGCAAGAEWLRRERLVRYLVAAGFRTFVARPERSAPLRPLCARGDAQPVFFAEDWEPVHLPRTPTLVVDPPDQSVVSILSGMERDLRVPLVIWVAADRRDPTKRHCLLRHTLAARSFLLEEFCTEVGL